MKTIMLCLNKLGIGGVETAVLNQTIQLIKRNYRVVILAADGIYRENFEKEGAIFINFEFVVQNKYDVDKIQYVIKILEEYNIEQVYIHQFDCINTVFPACMLKKIPYVAYLHNGIMKVYEWFEECFPCYKIMFSLYFHNAKRIVAIRESTKKENMEKYDIEESKYIVKKNSIDFNKFKVEENTIPTKIEKFLIISRMSKEKEKSIENAILLFKNYHKKNSNARLTIVGDGELKNKIQDEIEEIKDVAEILGQRNDIPQIMSKHDVVIAVDRCILEAITMKKLAIISGYEVLKELVTEANIDQASNENFSGENLKDSTFEEMSENLQKLDEDSIKNIVEQNYKYAYENLNIEKNVYILDEEQNQNTQINTNNAVENIIKLQNMYAEHIDYTDRVYKECKEAEKWYQGQIEIRDKQLEDLKKYKETNDRKIEKMNKNKGYKIANKIKRFLEK